MIFILNIMQSYQGSNRDSFSDYADDLSYDYQPPPSVVSRNVILEGQLNVWNELRKFDQENTGKDSLF